MLILLKNLKRQCLVKFSYYFNAINSYYLQCTAQTLSEEKIKFVWKYLFYLIIQLTSVVNCIPIFINSIPPSVGKRDIKTVYLFNIRMQNKFSNVQWVSVFGLGEHTNHYPAVVYGFASSITNWFFHSHSCCVYLGG